MTPAVTIITPTTKDRHNYNIQCANLANKQDYPNTVEHLFDFSDKPIGAKRNNLCNQAKADIIIHFDSDDYYSPDYVSKSVAHLVKTGADITGLSSAYFYNPRKWLKRYDYGGSQGYALGATFCYWRKTWEAKPFREISNGEDFYFMDGNIVNPHRHIDTFVAIVHDDNTTGTQKYKGRKYTPLMADLSIKILGENYSKYPMF